MSLFEVTKAVKTKDVELPYIYSHVCEFRLNGKYSRLHHESQWNTLSMLVWANN